MQWRLISTLKFLSLFVWVGCVTNTVAPLNVNTGLAKVEVVSTDNKKVMLQDLMGQNGLVIIQHRSDCPIVRRYSSEVERIRNLVSNKKINVIYLNSSGDDTAQKLLEHIHSYNVKVPIYIDPQGTLTKGLKMQRTSEAVLLTPRYETVYQGAVDDSLDYESRKPAEHHYLLDAVTSYEYRRPIATPQTEARGCLVE